MTRRRSPERANPDDFGELLTIADTAAILGIHIDTARAHARNGVLPAHRLPTGTQFYVLKDELLDWIRRQPVGSRPGPPKKAEARGQDRAGSAAADTGTAEPAASAGSGDT